MTEEAIKKKREYIATWKKKNKDRVNEYQRKWRKDNPDKVKAYSNSYWERQALEGARSNE